MKKTTIYQTEATAFNSFTRSYDYINLPKTVNSTIGLTYMNNKNI